MALQNESDAYRKMRLRVEDVQGRNCLTNFWVSAGGRDCSGLTWGPGTQCCLCLETNLAAAASAAGRAATATLGSWKGTSAQTAPSRQPSLLDTCGVSQPAHVLSMTCWPFNLCSSGHDRLVGGQHNTGHCMRRVTLSSLKMLQGMDFTTDKLRALVRKWQTLIESHVDVKTTDGYTLRMFCIGFTKKRPGQVTSGGRHRRMLARTALTGCLGAAHSGAQNRLLGPAHGLSFSKPTSALRVPVQTSWVAA